MNEHPTAVAGLLAEVRAAEAGQDATRPESIFRPPRLIEAIVTDLKQSPGSFAVDDQAIAATATGLTAFEVRGSATWAEVALRTARLLGPGHDRDVDEELDALFPLVRATGAVAVAGAGGVPEHLVRSLPDGSPVRELIVRLGQRAAEPSVAFVALLGLHLAGQDLKATRPATTSVGLVTDSPFAVTATTARLSVQEVRGGPTGAAPDPRSMFGLRSRDQRLAASVERARRQVDPEGLRSFRWTVSLEAPLLEIEGPSLAAGWAVAGLELTARARRRPRVRAVSERITITGDVADDGSLGVVDHIERKARAAHADRRKGFVFPSAAKVDLSGFRSSQFVTTPASDVVGAHRAARNAYDRSLVVMGIAGIVILAMLAIGLVWQRETSNERKAAAIAAQGKDLLAEALRLNASDLRASLLIAYESDQLDSSPAARALMTEGVGQGSSLVRVLPTDAEAVGVEAIRPVEEGDAWQAAVLDERGAITFADIETGEVLASMQPDDQPYLSFAINPMAPWIVTATENTVTQTGVPDVDGAAAPDLEGPTCPGSGRPLLAISHDGTRIAAARDTYVCVWDALTGERIAVVEPARLPTADDDGSVAGSAVTALALGSDHDTLYVGRSGGFDVIHMATWDRRSFATDPELDVVSLATYLAADSSTDTVLVATVSGIHALFPEASATTRLPGSGAEVRSVETNVDGSLVIAGYADELVRLDAGSDFAPTSGSAAISVPVPRGARPDVGLVDVPDGQVLATLGGDQAVLLGGRVPAQQWAAIAMGADGGFGLSSDASRVVTFGESTATGYKLTPGVRNVVDRYGDGTTLDLPAQIDDVPIRIGDVVFTADDERIIVYGYTYVGRDEETVPFVRLFDAETFAPLRDLSLPTGAQRQISTVLEVGDELLAVDVIGRVHGFDLESGETTRTLELDVDAPIALAATPDADVVALAWSKTTSDGDLVQPPDGSVSFYAYPSLEPLGASVPAPGQAIWHLAFLDASTLLVHGADEKVYEMTPHDGVDGSAIWQADAPLTFADGQQTVGWFDTTRDGSRVVLSDAAGVSIVRPARWDTAEVVLSTGDAEVGIAAFIPGGDGVVVTTDDTLQLWRLPSDDLLEQICSVVGTGFSEEEWQEHLDDLPYVERCPKRTADEVVEADASSEEFAWMEGEPSLAEPVDATDASCADFAVVQADGCIAYGDDDSDALVLTEAGEDDDASAVLTQWSRVVDRWEPGLRYEVWARPEDLVRVDVVGQPSQAGFIAAYERARPTALFDGDEVIFDDDGGESINGSTIVLNKAVPRGAQATYQYAYHQQVFGWDGDEWSLESIAPGAVFSADRRLLAPDSLAGVALGEPFLDAVAAVDAELEGAIDPDLPRTIVAWADGLSETATETWGERAPADLTEACWARQLCAYGDETGALVGWRYDSGRARRIGSLTSQTARSADRLALRTVDGTPTATLTEETWRDGAWPPSSLQHDGELAAIVIGTVHPKGGLATLPATEAMTDARPLAGAQDWRALTLGDANLSVTFDAGLTYRWSVEGDRLVFSEWGGSGPVGVGVRDSDGELVAAGALPTPGTGGWTLALCSRLNGVTVTATGPSEERSWAVTATGLIAADPAASCWP